MSDWEYAPCGNHTTNIEHPCADCKVVELQAKLDEGNQWETDFWIVNAEKVDAEAKVEELQAKLDEQAEALDRYANGFQGGCYCCETVATKNMELQAENKRLNGLVARFREERLSRILEKIG